MVRTSISSPMDVGDGPGTIGRVCHSTVCTINTYSPTQMDQKVRAARRVGTQGAVYMLSLRSMRCIRRRFARDQNPCTKKNPPPAVASSSASEARREGGAHILTM